MEMRSPDEDCANPGASMELDKALQRLREMSSKVEEQAGVYPEVMQPFVDLARTQTEVLEAFITFHRDKPLKRQGDQPELARKRSRRESTMQGRQNIRSRASDRSARSVTASQPNISNIAHTVSLDSTGDTSEDDDYQTVCESRESTLIPMAETSFHQYADKQSTEHSHQFGGTLNSTPLPQRPFDWPTSIRSRPQSVPLLQLQHRSPSRPRLDDRPRRPSTPTLQTTPPLQERSWYNLSTPPERNNSSTRSHSCSSSPKDALSPRHPKSGSNTNSLHSRTSVITDTTTTTSNSTSTCRTCDLHTHKTSLHETDTTVESHVQEALLSLIASTKEKKKVPVGPLAGGSFTLYSSEYRRHYCAGDRSEDQKLRVLDKSSVASDANDSVDDKADHTSSKVAMSLIIQPMSERGKIFVKSFDPPKHASWKWHTLDATFYANESSDNHMQQRETKLDFMFLGDGFLKLKIRLSELLGEGMVEDGLDRFVEFAGIWRKVCKKGMVCVTAENALIKAENLQQMHKKEYEMVASDSDPPLEDEENTPTNLSDLAPEASSTDGDRFHNKSSKPELSVRATLRDDLTAFLSPIETV